LFLSLVIVVTLLSDRIAAQEINPCLIPPPPFALTEANRLGDAEIRRAFAGRTNEHVRRPNPAAFADRRTGAPWRERYLAIEWRTDGSFFYRCEEVPHGETAPRPCLPAPGGRGAGASDIGTWRVANRLLCYTFSWAGTHSERCISVHRQDGRTVARSASGGWTCVEGEIHFK
jgi:hypothetical protein